MKDKTNTTTNFKAKGQTYEIGAEGENIAIQFFESIGRTVKKAPKYCKGYDMTITNKAGKQTKMEIKYIHSYDKKFNSKKEFGFSYPHKKNGKFIMFEEWQDTTTNKPEFERRGTPYTTEAEYICHILKEDNRIIFMKPQEMVSYIEENKNTNKISQYNCRNTQTLENGKVYQNITQLQVINIEEYISTNRTCLIFEFQR